MKRFSSEEVGAVEEVRFASETTADHTIWTAEDGRAKIWTGDMFKVRSNGLYGIFSAFAEDCSGRSSLLACRSPRKMSRSI
jgi:hypothetical protein